MTGTLHITRGLPGSGKSTWAKAWVDQDCESRRVRVNRDDLRFMSYGVYHGLTRSQEDTITKLQQALVRAALTSGKDVVVDDTNLINKFAKEWLKLAKSVGADVEWHDEFLDVDINECIRRDKARERQVGEEVIRSMARRIHPGHKRPELDVDEPGVHEPYTGTPGKPSAVLVDLDGTVALNGPDRDHPNRGYFDWSRVDEDLPNKAVISLVWTLREAGHRIIFVSGRTDEGPCRELTQKWLDREMGWSGPLIMRETDCGRKDSIVKLELFDKYIRDNYDVQFCIDDRDQVVKAYRSIGLTVLQVNDGDF